MLYREGAILFCRKEGVGLVKVEFECRRCGKIVTAEQYKIDSYCPNPNCKTYLQKKPQPKHWLFQFNPSVYNWFDRIKQTNEPEQWLISQSSSVINKDDLVAVWSSEHKSQKSGVYALGKIITKPAKIPLNINQLKYFSDPSYANKFEEKPSAYAEYFKTFLDNPLLQEQCHRDPALKGMQVFINPQGTNFRLTYEQWERIQEVT